MDVDRPQEHLHNNEVISYEKAFAPQTARLVKAWERAPVSAQAPRFRGQKIWKRAGSQPRRNKENYEETHIELDREGDGARKKLRVMGAKQNLGEATWHEVVSHATKNAEGNDNGSCFKDYLRIPLKEKSSNVLASIPRKRTNADRIITPRRSLCNSNLDNCSEDFMQQSSIPLCKLEERLAQSSFLDLALERGSVSDKPLRKQKPLRRSIRASMNFNATVVEKQIISPGKKLKLQSHVICAATSAELQATHQIVHSGLLKGSSEQTILEPCGAHLQTRSQSCLSPDEVDSPDAKVESCEPLGIRWVEGASTDESISSLAAQDRRSPVLEENKAGLFVAEGPLPEVLQTDIHGCGIATCQASGAIRLEDIEQSLAFQEPPFLAEHTELKTIGRSSQRSPRRSTRVRSSLAHKMQPLALATAGEHPASDEATTSDHSAAIDASAVGKLVNIPLGEPSPQTGLEQLDLTGAQRKLPSELPISQPMALRVSNPPLVSAPPRNADSLPLEGAELSSIEPLKRPGVCQFSKASSIVPIQEDNIGDIYPDHAILSSGLVNPTRVQMGDDKSSTEETLVGTSNLCLTDVTGFVKSTYSSSARSTPLGESFSGVHFALGFDASLGSDDVLNEIAVSSERSLALPDDETKNIDPVSLAPKPQVTSEEVTPTSAAPSAYDHDDTDMLRNFLTRAKAIKAARAEEAQPVRNCSSPHSPLQNPLADTEPMVSPADEDTKHEFDVSIAACSPRKRRKLTSLGVGKATEPTSVRRSGRTRLPVKAPLTAPSFIPIRRLGQDEDTTVMLVRSQEKELAALTKVNTRKNKSGASSVADFLANQIVEAEKEKDERPSGLRLTVKQAFQMKVQSKQKDNGYDTGKRRKTVVWAEALVEYQGVSGLQEETRKDLMVETEKLVMLEENFGLVATKAGVGRRIPGRSMNGTPAPKKRIRNGR